ncbi:MAG: hypothetical protein ACJ74F_20390 [Mycobacterium sp.]|uniref:hypothetical protein n=1 Tax=Mycobacterium sp. TaxID=1785 RepID=UPI003899E995
MTFLTAGLVLGCTIIYGVEEPAMHYPMVATVGVLVAANLFLVLDCRIHTSARRRHLRRLCLRSSGSPTPN